MICRPEQDARKRASLPTLILAMILKAEVDQAHIVLRVPPPNCSPGKANRMRNCMERSVEKETMMNVQKSRALPERRNRRMALAGRRRFVASAECLLRR